MTARPVGDGDGHDELRELLADRIPFTTSVLFHGPSEWPNRDERLRIADLLLPVVAAYAEQRARERAAEELRAAADVILSAGSAWHVGDQVFAVEAARLARARADWLGRRRPVRRPPRPHRLP